MEFRFATIKDAPLLAEMNQRLIGDEGHRNSMSPAELEQRMTDWLATDGYRAVLFESGATAIGYCLYRHESDHVYVRQYYVASETRRQGIATAAWRWLTQNAWEDAIRIRLDVLVGNTAGIAFWRSLGFLDYCVTMELERQSD